MTPAKDRHDTLSEPPWICLTSTYVTDCKACTVRFSSGLWCSLIWNREHKLLFDKMLRTVPHRSCRSLIGRAAFVKMAVNCEATGTGRATVSVWQGVPR